MDQPITNAIHQRIQKILEVLKTDLGTIRTGRAMPALVENVVVSVYGGSAKMRVMEVGTVGAQDSQTLLITPFDASIIGEIQKGIQEANTGLNPVVDGHVIRISIQPLSQERREELIKLMRQKLENGRVMVRQARHEAMTDVKKQESDLSEDEVVRLEKEIQKIVDEAMSTIDRYGKQKEDELLQI